MFEGEKPSPESHPEAEARHAFLAGQLQPEAAASFEQHLDVCPTCRKDVSELVRARRGDASNAETDVVDVPALPVTLGQTIDGRYRVERLLGMGGMGAVYRAHHLHLNQAVALKFMLPELVKDANAVARFTREARAVVRLRSEHVGRVLDLGTLEDGTPYLVMEFLSGEPVDQRLTREGPLSPVLAVELILQAASALAEAHNLGIIHRDLKPANLFLARLPSGREVVKVLDFGIAKSVHPDIEAGLEVSSQRFVVGSPQYMAPEQLTPSVELTPAADVWALGCTLYQLLCGEPPFFAEGSLVNLMYAIQNRPHPSLASRVPRAAKLSPIVDRCLEKDPQRRISLAQLETALRSFAAESRSDTQDSSRSKSPRGGRAKWAWALGPVLALALGAGIWLRRASPKSSQPPALTTPEASLPLPAPRALDTPTNVTPLPTVPLPSVVEAEQADLEKKRAAPATRAVRKQAVQPPSRVDEARLDERR